MQDKLNPVKMFEGAKKEAQDAHAREIELIKLRMELADHISEAELSAEARELMKLNQMLTYRDAVLEIRSVMDAYRKAMVAESEEKKEWKEREQEWQKEWQKECQKVWQKVLQEREQEW